MIQNHQANSPLAAEDHVVRLTGRNTMKNQISR